MVKLVSYFVALIMAKEVLSQATLLEALVEKEAYTPRSLQTSPSPSPSKPTNTTPGTPLPCPIKPWNDQGASNAFPLASGTYAISSDLVCPVDALSNVFAYYIVSAGSKVIINIPAEGVNIRALIIEVAGGNVKVHGGPITFSGNAATPFNVYDGGLLTINSDVVYTGGSKRMIYSGYVLPVSRAGGTIVFGGTASFTYNVGTCSSACFGMAIQLANGASLTFKKKAEFKFNTAPTYLGYGGGAIFMSDSTLVFESSAVFESNQGSRGGALYISAGSSVLFKGSATFTNNYARTSGGAILNWGSTVSFAQTAKFNGNIATSTTLIPNGGAIYDFVSTTTPAVSPVTKFCVLPTGTDLLDSTKFYCGGCQTTIAC